MAYQVQNNWKCQDITGHFHFAPEDILGLKILLSHDTFSLPRQSHLWNCSACMETTFQRNQGTSGACNLVSYMGYYLAQHVWHLLPWVWCIAKYHHNIITAVCHAPKIIYIINKSGLCHMVLAMKNSNIVDTMSLQYHHGQFSPFFSCLFDFSDFFKYSQEMCINTDPRFCVENPFNLEATGSKGYLCGKGSHEISLLWTGAHFTNSWWANN